MRIESTKSMRNGGWLHRLNGQAVGTRQVKMRDRPVAGCNWEALASMYSAAVRPALLAEFAAGMRLSVESLRRLGIGWDGENWTLPMRDGAGRIIGIQLRPPVGRKHCVPGSRLGIFIPEGVGNNGAELLLICEGASDTAAMTDLGYECIGRASCASSAIYIRTRVYALVHSNTYSNRVLSTYKNTYTARQLRVVIVADADEPGIKGANELAKLLHAEVVLPPDGAKDARAAVRDRARWEELLDL